MGCGCLIGGESWAAGTWQTNQPSTGFHPLHSLKPRGKESSVPAREPVPEVTKRELWMESMGHCMNPTCERRLVVNGAYVAELAHITARGDGGGVEFNNLICLCPNCHTAIDNDRNAHTVGVLRTWKKERSEAITARFSKKFRSFQELQAYVVPLLRSNRSLHEQYGPADSESSDDGRHALWVASEAEMVVNNRKILLALRVNLDMLHKENQDVVQEFKRHTAEFVRTRGVQIHRVQLFPSRLNSLFGEEEVDMDPAPNLGALENFVRHLIDEGRFESLELEPRQIVSYWERDRPVRLDLCNRPWVQQMYWTNGLYPRSGTEMRVRTVVFLLEWLTRNGIMYEFPEESVLTRIVVGGRQSVHLAYEYLFSVADLHRIKSEDGLVVVNMHHWNSGPFTDDAKTQARRIGLRLFNQEAFFSFALRELAAS